MGTAEERQQEQYRVDRVTREIDRRIHFFWQQADETKTDIVGIRKNFWEDVRVNVDDPVEATETAVSIKQQAEVLAERERRHRHAQKRLNLLERIRKSPYFGRVDFMEEGEKEAERIYIGIASLRDETDEHFLIYDWRAPVSSLYYDGTPGPEQYETPGGTVVGTIELKRQYVIRDGRIRSMFDTGVTIGDTVLQEVLGNKADAQMKSIVATIQKEQNRIIRDENHQLLIVQGVAGSGKTSVALQRVAYLLYQYRETLRAEQILLFSPNPMFNRYVATVLPELGEENMQQTTFQEHLEWQIGKFFRLEDPFDQMEFVLNTTEEPGYRERIRGIRYKASMAFMHLLDRYLMFLGKEGMLFKEVRFRDEVLFSAAGLRTRFDSLDPSLSISRRIQRLADQLLEELNKRARLERTQPWVESEMELLDSLTYVRTFKQLQKKKRFSEDTFDDFERERDQLAAMIVEKHIKPLRSWVKRLGFIDLPAIYRQLFSDPEAVFRFAPDVGLPKDWKQICKQTVERLDRFELAYEDAPPFLYLKEQIEGFETHASVRHVFIDEAQDYSPFQLAMIRRRYPSAGMTVLGDMNQMIFAHATVGNGLAALRALYESEPTKIHVLNRSYRSTRQIVEFSRALIPGGEGIEPFRRDGDLPTLTQTADSMELHTKMADRIRSLQISGHRSIAVICKTARESREVYEALREKAPLHLVRKETSAVESGVMVLPVYLAKGIEFDAVIVHNASQERYGRESERRLLYTACTRAMHELHVYYKGEWSPFLAGVPSDTYVSCK